MWMIRKREEVAWHRDTHQRGCSEHVAFEALIPVTHANVEYIALLYPT